MPGSIETYDSESESEVTCPSDVPNHDVDNDIHHWFGCVKHAELEEHRQSLANEKRKLIDNAEARIGQLRRTFREHEANQPEPKAPQASKLFGLFTNSLRKWRELPPHTETTGYPIREREPATHMEDSLDLKTTVLAYKKGKGYDLQFPTVTAHFPSQKISLHTLLHEKDEDRNPLYRECPSDTIQYFHLPANNLRWVEEAIARYYHEPTPDLEKHFDKISPDDASPRTKMLLEPQYWRGLEHGVASHAKHMRPRCHTVSTCKAYLKDTDENSCANEKSEKKLDNVVLFMPYFHWETDRRRMISAKLIQSKKDSMEQVVDKLPSPSFYRKLPTPSFRRHEQLLSKSLTGWRKGGQEENPVNLDPQPNSSMHCGPELQKLTKHEQERQKRRQLSHVLWYAAALYEAMDSYTDECLIRKYMKGTKKTLHARRTLDQAYYWSQDTHTRDRDQVVYRGTSSLYKANHAPCTRRDHEKPCDQCTDHVTHVPRLVMVDQLWMWILDERTIITAFPRRWGRNKPDTSGVHKSIRTRLGAARADEIRTVYDLAVVIFEQCCRVFFDRTKVLDQQPEVMDLFATAIGKVAYKQTIAFEAFWEYTREAAKAYRSRSFVDANIWQQKLLDIHPEGQLLRENADIIDELHIMINIKKQQKDVAKIFVEKIKGLMDSELRQTNPDVEKQRKENRDRTEKSLNALLANIDYQMEELKTLQEAAKHTSESLQALLGLKQQQASIVGAQEALRQGRETVKQGQSIMLFTVISIVFLPLSFCSSVFGMNVTELGTQDSFNFNDTFKYMFPISIGVVTVSLVFAFSGFGQSILNNGNLLLSLIESSILFPFRKIWVWAITRSWIYGLWVALWGYSRELKEKERRWIEARKTIARRERREMRILVNSVGWLQRGNEKLEGELRNLQGGISTTDRIKDAILGSGWRGRSMRQKWIYRLLISLWGFARERREREKEEREQDKKDQKEKEDKEQEEKERADKKKNQEQDQSQQKKNKKKKEEEERREVTWLVRYADELSLENEVLKRELEKKKDEIKKREDDLRKRDEELRSKQTAEQLERGTSQAAPNGSGTGNRDEDNRRIGAIV